MKSDAEGRVSAMTYSVAAYNAMIADSVRTDAYTRAMQATIGPGTVVADIGTGCGYFAILAAKLGAKKVFAIEPSPAIELARQAARDNGCFDKIDFIQAMSTDITLPERVDVIVADLRGSLPFFRNNIPSIADCRSRFLKQGGILMPSSDEIFAALVNSRTVANETSVASDGSDGRPDMSVTTRPLRNRVLNARVKQAECVTAVSHLGTLDYLTVQDSSFSAAASWSISEATTANAVCVWFDAQIHDGIGYSNSPSSMETVYGRSVFPLLEPVSLEPGDVCALKFHATLVGSEYVFRWNTTVSAEGSKAAKVSFKQSTMNPTIVSSAFLRRRRSDFVPSLERNHEYLRFVLNKIDGSADLESIAKQLSAAHPNEFPNWMAALRFVADAV